MSNNQPLPRPRPSGSAPVYTRIDFYELLRKASNPPAQKPESKAK